MTSNAPAQQEVHFQGLSPIETVVVQFTGTSIHQVVLEGAKGLPSLWMQVLQRQSRMLLTRVPWPAPACRYKPNPGFSLTRVDDESSNSVLSLTTALPDRGGYEPGGGRHWVRKHGHLSVGCTLQTHLGLMNGTTREFNACYFSELAATSSEQNTRANQFGITRQNNAFENTTQPLRKGLWALCESVTGAAGCPPLPGSG